jgi:uncharacterized protein (TIGR01244 family)
MRIPPARLLLACLACVFAAPLPAAEGTSFTEPRPGLHTGGQPDAARLRAFAADGGKVVIDLRGAGEQRGYDEAALARALGLRYVPLPIAGGDDLTDANAAALAHALAEADGPVLLHCASGNRVGALLALAAAQHEALAPQAALELGRRAGLKSLEPVVRERLGIVEPR